MYLIFILSMYNILHSFSYKESGLHSNQCEKLVQGHTLEEGKSGFKLRTDRFFPSQCLRHCEQNSPSAF